MGRERRIQPEVQPAGEIIVVACLWEGPLPWGRPFSFKPVGSAMLQPMTKKTAIGVFAIVFSVAMGLLYQTTKPFVAKASSHPTAGGGSLSDNQARPEEPAQIPKLNFADDISAGVRRDTGGRSQADPCLRACVIETFVATN